MTGLGLIPDIIVIALGFVAFVAFCQILVSISGDRWDDFD